MIVGSSTYPRRTLVEDKALAEESWLLGVNHNEAVGALNTVAFLDLRRFDDLGDSCLLVEIWQEILVSRASEPGR